VPSDRTFDDGFDEPAGRDGFGKAGRDGFDDHAGQDDLDDHAEQGGFERRSRPRVDAGAERAAHLRFRDWRFRVRDILSSVEAIVTYAEGMTFEQFVADRKTVDAVVRNLMMMGESVRWVPEPIRDAWPQVPWRTLREVRNVVVHEYFGVDPKILWQTVRGDLPPLIPELEAVLRS
jgi:uncharacterized protein with HEPN domain